VQYLHQEERVTEYAADFKIYTSNNKDPELIFAIAARYHKGEKISFSSTIAIDFKTHTTCEHSWNSDPVSIFSAVAEENSRLAVAQLRDNSENSIINYARLITK